MSKYSEIYNEGKSVNKITTIWNELSSNPEDKFFSNY